MNEQIEQIKANSNLFTSTAIRGVLGGFVVTGQIQYQDKATKGIVLTENAEGVAANAQQAAQMSLNYHNTGNFDGTQQNTAQADFGFGAAAQPAGTQPSAI